MTRKFLTAALAAMLLLSGSISAQVTFRKISTDRVSAAGIHTPYKVHELHDTPAPEGYVPFYISHTARHGSRYNTNERELTSLTVPLHKCDSMGILTSLGKELKRRVDLLYSESEGRFGALSDRGAREHAGIADRMYRRYPQVFSDPDRRNIGAASSTSLRCVLSMANFALGLVRNDSTLNINFSSDDRTKAYLMKNTGIGKIEDARREITTPVRKEMFNPNRFFESIVTDQESLKEAVNDRSHFCKNLYVAGGIVYCVDLEDQADLYEFFTDDELYTLALLDSYDFYGDHANSREFGKTRVAMDDELVENIISRADLAMTEGSHTAADIRFTHDWMISPLLAMIGIDGMYRSYRLLDVGRYWMTSDYIPMAANLQMIFYKSPDSRDVLVKLLHNENEVLLSGLKSDLEPYYRWSELKPYLYGRIQYFTE